VVTTKKKILVVGAGISGITAAYVLSQRHQVTLLERNDYVGGHTNTRIVRDPLNPELAVDTGFIVCNPQNYPNFYQFLRQLKVNLQPSDMSFGFSCERSGLQYMGPSVKEFLQAPGNLFSIKFVGMILEQRRFNQRVLRDMEAGRLDNIPLSEYLRQIGISDFFVENYLTPLIGSIWSAPDARTLDFPALTFATFFKNHGMLELSKRPQWQTVVGGSHSYIKAFRERFSGILRSASEVRAISRQNESVVVHRDGAEPERFDAVVIATHADEALKLLADPSDSERTALSAWSYSTNRTVLHTDASVLAPNRRLWAAWNYRRTLTSRAESPVAITYYMNKLQNLVAQRDYFVTLNCTDSIDPQKVLYEVAYTHPIYTPDSPESQRRLRALNGEQNTYFCGAYMRYGFHEDGVMSALDVAAKFGLSLRDIESQGGDAPQRVVDMAV
jgi:predicted NAD/FAD-binding protein